MSMKTLEAAILKEAKEVTGNSKLRHKDIMKWLTGKHEHLAEEGEEFYYLPELGVSIAVKVQ